MSDKKTEAADRVSRRDFLNIAALGGTAVFAIGFASSPASASTKMSHSDAGYQGYPKDKQRCDGCNFWQAPVACKVVESPVAPGGWCTLYQPKK